MLEAQFHSVPSTFQTFTYDVEPPGGTLLKSQISAALHRLRTLATREGLESPRFYACGEYGTKRGRPHYHAAIFGLPPTHRELIDRAWHSGNRDRDQHGFHGHVDHGLLTADSAAYIAGYVTSKLKQAGVAELRGREPQFAVMSRNPGIGLKALAPILEAFSSPAGHKYLQEHGDVPTSFMVGTKILPLGPYIRQNLRLVLLGDHRQPDHAKKLREKAFHEHRDLAYLPPLSASATLSEKAEAQLQANVEAYDSWASTLRQKSLKADKRHNISNSRKTL